jgi:outer membrane biosynthesis protein TonB
MKNEQESDVHATADQRRRFLRLFGATAALLPITAIVGCSDDAPAPPPSPSNVREPEPEPAPQQAQAPAEPEPMPEPAPEPEPEPAMEEPAMEQAAEPMADAASGEMPRVDLNDPTAQALGYKHDAANVDASKYPDRDPAHRCANCILYQGAPGDEWGGCSLFPGKLVNANGWCSSYTPKAG